jgi:hypothetical protein
MEALRRRFAVWAGRGVCLTRAGRISSGLRAEKRKDCTTRSGGEPGRKARESRRRPARGAMSRRELGLTQSATIRMLLPSGSLLIEATPTRGRRECYCLAHLVVP